MKTFEIHFTRLLADKRLIRDVIKYNDRSVAERQLAFLIFSKDIFNIRVLAS